MTDETSVAAEVVCMLADLLDEREMTLVELSDRTGITTVNLSKLKNGHARAIRFTTLVAICNALKCQPGDFLHVAPPAPNRLK